MSQTLEREIEKPAIDNLGAKERPPVVEEHGHGASGLAETTDPPKPPRSHLSRWIVVVVAAVAAAGVGYWWMDSQKYESTDDAQVEGHLDLVSSRISGTVISINPRVENNQAIEAGTLLLELDPRDYAAELDHAGAVLATRSAEAQSAQVTIPITDAISFGRLHSAEAARAQALAAVDSAEANLAAAQHRLQQDAALSARAERDRGRYEALVEKREISRSDYDARETEAIAAAQAVESDRAAVASSEQKIAEARSLVVQRDAEIQAARIAPQQVTNARDQTSSAFGRVGEARADLNTARLNLSYTKIYAPVTGVVGRKTVEVGHRVQPGQSLLAIVPLDDVWITANFKETQLKRMRPAQPVTVRVDSFGRDYKGHIENLPGAAGPTFSLFPPENATGNYVKVVQRFPVRIRIDKGQDPEQNLRPGMSVEPTVTVR
jgi:membrane fusion protein (multidrug efflux system)